MAGIDKESRARVDECEGNYRGRPRMGNDVQGGQ